MNTKLKKLLSCTYKPYLQLSIDSDFHEVYSASYGTPFDTILFLDKLSSAEDTPNNRAIIEKILKGTHGIILTNILANIPSSKSKTNTLIKFVIKNLETLLKNPATFEHRSPKFRPTIKTQQKINEVTLTFIKLMKNFKPRDRFQITLKTKTDPLKQAQRELLLIDLTSINDDSLPENIKNYLIELLQERSLVDVRAAGRAIVETPFSPRKGLGAHSRVNLYSKKIATASQKQHPFSFDELNIKADSIYSMCVKKIKLNQHIQQDVDQLVTLFFDYLTSLAASELEDKTKLIEKALDLQFRLLGNIDFYIDEKSKHIFDLNSFLNRSKPIFKKFIFQPIFSERIYESTNQLDGFPIDGGGEIDCDNKELTKAVIISGDQKFMLVKSPNRPSNYYKYLKANTSAIIRTVYALEEELKAPNLPLNQKIKNHDYIRALTKGISENQKEMGYLGNGTMTHFSHAIDPENGMLYAMGKTTIENFRDAQQMYDLDKITRELPTHPNVLKPIIRFQLLPSSSGKKAGELPKKALCSIMPKLDPFTFDGDANSKAISIARGLQALLHKGFVHNDVKVSNSLQLSRSSGSIIDYDLAFRITNETLDAGTYSGTYPTPEALQLRLGLLKDKDIIAMYPASEDKEKSRHFGVNSFTYFISFILPLLNCPDDLSPDYYSSLPNFFSNNDFAEVKSDSFEKAIRNKHLPEYFNQISQFKLDKILAWLDTQSIDASLKIDYKNTITKDFNKLNSQGLFEKSSLLDSVIRRLLLEFPKSENIADLKNYKSKNLELHACLLWREHLLRWIRIEYNESKAPYKRSLFSAGYNALSLNPAERTTLQEFIDILSTPN